MSLFMVIAGGDLRSRSTFVLVTWMKDHAKQVDVDRGRTAHEDKVGNDVADELAVAGANMHRATTEVVEAARERMRDAMSVQRMMLAVLHARALPEFASQSDAIDAGIADRGSDCDGMDLDCMELDCLELTLDDEFGDGV